MNPRLLLGLWVFRLRLIWGEILVLSELGSLNSLPLFQSKAQKLLTIGER